MRTPSTVQSPASFQAPQPVYSSDQLHLGQCGVALTLAFKHLLINRSYAIGWIQREIEILSQFSEPDMRRMCRLALSFLSSDEVEALQSIQPELENKFLFELELAA